MQGIKQRVATLSLAITSLLIFSPLKAKQPDECTCWYFGYKAQVVGHTKETATGTLFFKQCIGPQKPEAKIGTESDYWAGWKAAESKLEMVCPYTESTPTQ